MQDFHSLDVWKRSHELVLNIYKSTQSMPRDEVFGITMQLRRSSASIATRIAEGCGKESRTEFTVELRRAVALCNEVEYALLLAKDLEHMKEDVWERLTGEAIGVRKMLYGLLKKL